MLQGLIALGIAPGIKSLAYCALEWRSDEQRGVVLHQDVMSPRYILRADDNGRAPSLAVLTRRFYCHQLILTTVWERYPPEVLSVGPPATTEAAKNVELARKLVTELGRFAGVTVVHSSVKDLEKAFATTPWKTLKGALKRRVSSVPRDHRGILAAAAAFYGLAQKEPALLTP